MPNMNIDEIKQEAEELCGWDTLKVSEIHKYGAEAVVKTTRGDVRMTMEELFKQDFFLREIFCSLGVGLEKVKETIYKKWLMKWATSIKDMGAVDNGTDLEFYKDLLETYLEDAEEEDILYLKKGYPVIIEPDVIAFRI